LTYETNPEKKSALLRQATPQGKEQQQKSGGWFSYKQAKFSSSLPPFRVMPPLRKGLSCAC
jgi:hypothetical protein